MMVPTTAGMHIEHCTYTKYDRFINNTHDGQHANTTVACNPDVHIRVRVLARMYV